MTETLLSQIRSVIDNAAAAWDHNAGEEPVALLWPDKASQWSDIIPELRESHRVITLGKRDESEHAGPAYWIRCVVAGSLPLDGLPETRPIVYLPGVGRDDFRDPKELPARIAPLGALPHRSLWFTHINGKDWTVRSLLQNEERGLGLAISSDEATGKALEAALPELCQESMKRLTSRFIDVDFLADLLNPDLVGAILRWLDDPATAREQMGAQRWNAFTQKCTTDYGLDPKTDGELEAARRLGLRSSAQWDNVWNRFVDNAANFAGIQQRLNQAQPQELIVEHPDAWPAVNTAAEDQLRTRLRDLEAATREGALKEIAALEEEHGPRRDWVWADLGQSPLAQAMRHLAQLAELTAAIAPGSTVDGIQAWYATDGWRADDAMIRSLGAVTETADLAAVSVAATAFYRDWAHFHALALQAAVGPLANVGNYKAGLPAAAGPGTVTVFVDGLRLDIAHRLGERLRAFELQLDLEVDLAALPTITESAKPAVAPVPPGALTAGEHLNAARAESGATANAPVLRSLMEADGIAVLAGTETGDPGEPAWTETGEVDHKGHDLGVRFPHEVDTEVARIAERIRSLLDAGWSTVQVVTDHGWLLLPRGLEKAVLPAAVYEPKARKGRCARLKPGADVAVDTVPWHWDEHVRIAVAPGISCFIANQVYEHGGVSPQECFVPRMTVRAPESGGAKTAAVAIASVRWSGLRCRVEVLDAPSNAGVDIRLAAGDPSSSVAMAAKQTTDVASISLLVPNEDLEGTEASLVIVGPNGELLAQRQVTIGHNE